MKEKMEMRKLEETNLPLQLMSATIGRFGRVLGKLKDGTSPSIGLNPYS